MAENERQFEENIEKYLISPDGGYEKADDSGYRASIDMALDIETLVKFVKKNSPSCGSASSASAILTR